MDTDVIVLNEIWHVWEPFAFHNFFGTSDKDNKINVSIHIRKKFNAWPISLKEDAQNILAVKLGDGANWLYLVSIYRSGSNREASLLSLQALIEIILTTCRVENCSMFIIGDLNYDFS
jgi:hypothetical protein